MTSCSAAARFGHVVDTRKSVKRPHDVLGAAKIGDRLEKRDDDKLCMSVLVAKNALHEAAFLLKDKSFKKIADGFGMADDVLPDGPLAVGPAKIAGLVEDRKFARGPFGIDDAGHAQGTRVPQDAQKRLLLLFFIESAVVRHDAGCPE